VRVPVKVGWLTLTRGKDMLAYGHTVADAGPGGQTRESATLPLASLPRHSARVASLPDQTCPHVPVPWGLALLLLLFIYLFIFAKESPF